MQHVLQLNLIAYFENMLRCIMHNEKWNHTNAITKNKKPEQYSILGFLFLLLVFCCFATNQDKKHKAFLLICVPQANGSGFKVKCSQKFRWERVRHDQDRIAVWIGEK